MSTKYNIYRLKREHEKELIERITSDTVKLTKITDKNIDGFRYRFYFSKEPDKVDIWWLTAYKDFLEEGQAEASKNNLFFGLLLISNDNILYAISLGKSHFYLKNYCDPDFGLNLAERIVNQNDLRIKNTKFFKSKKSKTIITYQKGSKIDYDGGESFYYLKAKTIDGITWGKVASFGNSAQLSLNIAPTELHTVIQKIEETLKDKPLFEVPKATEVRNAVEIKRLDEKLIRAIQKSENEYGVSTDEFSVSGVDFIFSDRNNHSLFLKGDYDTQEEIGEISIDRLRLWIRENNLNLMNCLNDIYVRISSDYGSAHSQPIKSVLDYVDDADMCCLIDGKWHQFNNSYITYLEEQADSLIPEYDKEFDVADTEDIEGKFIDRREKEGYSVLHKTSTTQLEHKYKWELTDLYKDQTLFFVKSGTTQKIGYVIDQAMNTVNLLQQNASKLNENVSVNRICLWIILKRSPIKKLSELKSLIFLMKIVEWKKTVTNANYHPVVKVNFA